MQNGINIKRLAVFILVVSGCLLLIGGGSSADRPTTQKTMSPEGWTVESVPPETIVKSLVKLTPISATILADSVVDVTLRNDYDKSVTAVAAAYGDKGFYYREYLSSEVKDRQRLASGATDIFHYEKPATSGQRIKIIAVVFSDRTSEGDQEQIQLMLDQRRGRKTQLTRMLPYFQDLANDMKLTRKTSGVSAQIFSTLKKAAESLPIESDDGTPLSTGLESGLRHGRAFILHALVSELEDALANKNNEEWYNSFGQKQTYSVEQNFRMKFERAHRYFMSLLDSY